MKKLIKIAFAALIVAIAGYGVSANQKVDTMSDLALTNMEALASGESGGNNRGYQHEGWCTNSFWPKWREYCNDDPAAKVCTNDDC